MLFQAPIHKEYDTRMKPLVHKVLRSIALAASMALAGCTWLYPKEMPPVTHVPTAAPLVKPIAPRGLALVLSGGSARGFAHIGVIKVLEQAGIRPDLVVGTSAGAIIGTLYASGKSGREIEAISREADGAMAGDTDWLRLIRLKSLGLRAGNALHAFIGKRIGNHSIEDMAIPLAVVATDLASGTATAFTRGDAGHAVHAACAVPGVFEPVDIGGRKYADGGLSSPLPVEIARKLGARIVIAVDVIYPPTDSPPPGSALDVLFQTFLVQTFRLKEHEIGQADLVIAPEMHTIAQYGFKDREQLIAAGEAAARAALPKIQALLRVKQ